MSQASSPPEEHTLPQPLAPSPFYALPWPAPAGMGWVEAPPDDPERATLTTIDGERWRGAVLAIDFAGQRLAFEPDQGESLDLEFGAVRSVLLSRPVVLKPVPGAGGPVRIGRRQLCRIRLGDGGELEAQVLALLAVPEGLFLYVGHYGDRVLRWFLPAHAVVHYRMGERAPRRLPGPGTTVPAAPSDWAPLSGFGTLSAFGGLSGPAALEPTRAAPPVCMEGDEFVHGACETRAEVERTLARQRMSPRRRLGDLLVAGAYVTAAQRDEAVRRQREDGPRALGEILIEMGACSREAVRQVLVGQLGVPAVRLAQFPLDPNAIKAITPELANRHLAMPLFRSDTGLVVALDNPLSWEAIHELEFFTGLHIEPCLASRRELLAAIAQFYGGQAGSEMITQLVQRLGEEKPREDAPPSEPLVTESDNTLVRLVNKMIVDACETGASDIHIEAGPGDEPSRVRFRVDGGLAPYIEVPRNFRNALVSRIKIMSGLDISEHRRPQDGKIRFDEFGPRAVELRVLTMPTAGGLEDVVLRILTAPRTLTLDQIGLAPRDLQMLRELANRSFGLLFVCGPTGSGKTTTLHSLLASINTPDRKIWTVEDPVEITQRGLCQVQVNARLGLTFPEVLRSFLRADPDVIMVGETRDEDTARTVIAASLTGHLVFSTMHTNSAVESVVRLLDFGLDPFNFSDALLGILGQRLVRRLCHCKQPHAATAGELQQLAQDYCRDSPQNPADVIGKWRCRYGAADGSIALYAPVGCETCDGTGYKGRIGVYELLVASRELKLAIQNRASTVDLLQLAAAGGMSTLMQDGIEKILQGSVDLKQVLASCR